MGSYLSRILAEPFEAAVAHTESALNAQGFGILSNIDVQQALREKLNVTFRKYRILGAFNPQFTHKALLTEDKIGAMLPCNVIVQEVKDGRVEVSAVNPIASMQAIDNSALKDLAGQVQRKLEKVIDSL